MGKQAEQSGLAPSPVETMAHGLTRWLGRTSAFLLVVLFIGAWLASRPFFDTRESWVDAIVVTLAIVTFLLILLLQRSQNKAVLSIQLKLNEIVATQQGASNRLIDLENLPEAEIARLHRHFQTLATQAKAEGNRGDFHTVEEAAGAKE